MSHHAGDQDWFVVEGVEEIESPALLIYPERVEENIRRMIAIAGHPGRLRPHVKTHKLAPIAKRNIDAGITKFKAATIAEAEMLGRCGAADVLLAYQPVGPNMRRVLELMKVFPQTRFSCLLDDSETAKALSQLAVKHGARVHFFLDLDCGQHRTGVPADENAAALYRAFAALPGLVPAGLHAYDGHISDTDPAVRKAASDAAFAPVEKLRERLLGAGLAVPTVVAGGTPPFPFHAARKDVECSPGTTVLWDHSYARLKDLDFLQAALVLTRVVSKPAADLICVDLGHKAIASENPHPRAHFLNAPLAEAVAHSEEHLVLRIDPAAGWKVGDCLYGVPRHICPTVALYGSAVVIEERRAKESWRIEARERHLGI